MLGNLMVYASYKYASFFSRLVFSKFEGMHPSQRSQSHNALLWLVSYWSGARVSPLRRHSHPAFPITANNSFIIDKQVLNYVFSELKRCFQAMRKWMMLFFFTVTDVLLNWSQPWTNTQLCGSCLLYACVRACFSQHLLGWIT